MSVAACSRARRTQAGLPSSATATAAAPFGVAPAARARAAASRSGDARRMHRCSSVLNARRSASPGNSLASAKNRLSSSGLVESSSTGTRCSSATWVFGSMRDAPELFRIGRRSGWAPTRRSMALSCSS
jgi:hypothetical protein